MSFYNIEEKISVQYVETKPYGSSSGSLRVYCPSSMPLIGMGKPKITPVSLNKSAYCNAADCKPSVSSKISTQNYVTAAEPYNQFEKPCYYFGDTLTVRPNETDFLSCRIYVEDEDNSTDWP